LNVSICLLGQKATLTPSKHDHSGRRSVALSGITSDPIQCGTVNQPTILFLYLMYVWMGQE
jgi:hypothetical protein